MNSVTKAGRSTESEMPLRYYADRIMRPSGKPFGIGVAPSEADRSDPAASSLAAVEFNHRVNPALGMNACYKGPQQWDFSEADRIVQEAQAANQAMTSLHLVCGHPSWHYGPRFTGPECVPEWLETGNYSKEQLIQLLQEHVTAVMTRYHGIIGNYVVVHDMLSDHGSRDWWYQQLGPEYVDIAFRQARQADPDATLIYNQPQNYLIPVVTPTQHDTCGSKGYVLTKVYADRLKEAGLADAVGVDINSSPCGPGYVQPSKATVLAAFQSYGLPVWITQLMVPQQSYWVTPWEEQQAALTATMIDAAMESGVCESFTVYGVSDRNSSWGDPCLWNADYRAKLNYYAVQQALMRAAPPM